MDDLARDVARCWATEAHGGGHVLRLAAFTSEGPVVSDEPVRVGRSAAARRSGRERRMRVTNGLGMIR